MHKTVITTIYIIKNRLIFFIMRPSFGYIVTKDKGIYTKSPNHSRSGLFLPFINGSPYDPYSKCNFFANLTIRFPFGILVSSSSVNTLNLMIAAK